MVEGRNGFTKLHLAITRDMHLANIANNVYPLWNPSYPKLVVKPESAPSFADLKEILEKVGGPYKWHLRHEYNNKQGIKEISKILKEPTSRHFSFWAGKEGEDKDHPPIKVGGVIVANVEPNLRRIFEKAHDDDETKQLDITPDMAERSVEIYKIGLFPEYTDRKWGRFLLADTLRTLFSDKTLTNDGREPDVVYLNTRNTNHTGVISFYTGLNMNVIHARTYANDLISQEEYDRKNGKQQNRRLTDKQQKRQESLALATL